MAYTTSLLIGPPNVLVQNTVYALPARACVLFSSAAVEISNIIDSGFTAQATSATTGLIVSGGFVRCTTGGPTVVLKTQ